jgi:RTX calcium-binding nonapeptide repeat (4 copies)
MERLEDRSLLAGLNLVISGNQLLTYNGDVEIASIVGDAQAGADNVTIQATGQVHFTGNVGGGGLHNVSVVARDIDVDPNVVVSTREIAGGANPATAASTGASGDLSFTAEHIDVGQGASIFAQGTSGFASGNVTLAAMSTTDLDWFFGIDVGLFQNTQSDAGIEVGQGATLKGRNVTLTAQAQTLKTAALTNDIDPASSSGLARLINFNGPIQVNANAAAVVSEAEATVVVHMGVTIVADENINLHTDALTDAQISTSGKYLGITFGRSAPTSTITVEGGATFTAGLDFAAEATTNNNLVVKTVVPAAGDAGSLSLSLGNTDSTSLVDLQTGALVQAHHANFKATNSNSISNDASIAGLRTGDRVGATVVLGDYASHATAQVNGQVTATGDVNVLADSTNTANKNSAAGNIQAALGPSSILDAINNYLGTTQFVLPAAYDASHGAAIVLNRSVNEAQALVGPNANINAGQSVTVQVESADNLDTTTTAKGLGLAVSAPSSTGAVESIQTTSATVDGAIVTAGGNVTVSADNAATATSKAAGTSLLKIDDHTTAAITGGANVHALQNILVKSNDGTQSAALAGPAAVAGVANIGLGLASESITKQTAATIAGGANVTADGTGSGLELSGKSIHGVAVIATGHTLLGDLAAAAGSSGVAGLAGSVSLHKLDETTHATIGGGATVNAGSSSNQTVYVLAQDDTNILGFGGAVQNGGAVGAGGGLDAGQITKDTRATIEQASVTANHDVQVLALSSEHVTSISGSLSMSGAVAIAGAAAGYSLPVTTKAVIGSGAVVTTPGSIVANADDSVDVNVIAGALSTTSGSPAAGAAAGLVVLDKNTTALVDSGANVTALGTLPAITTNSGRFGVSYQPDPARIPGMVAAGLLEVVGFVFENPIRDAIADQFNFQGDLDFLDITPVSAPPVDPDLANQRTVTDITRPIQGLAVVATSRDHVQALAAGLGTGGVLLPQFSAAALVTSNETGAFIGDGAQINQGGGGGATQGVLVAAGCDTYFASMAGAAALSSGGSAASVGGSFNLAVLDNDTEAGIGPNAHVSAAGDIEVRAAASEDMLAFAASATAGDSGVIEGAASFDLLVVHSKTHAFIGDNAVVNAGGNVLVTANDDTDIDVVAGQAGLGGSVIGAGASIATTAIVKDTQAFIGQGATVDAKGNSGGLMEVFNGTIDPALGTERIHGVAVQAHSTENVFGIVAAGSLGSKLGLAGAASIALIDSDTAAFVDKNAHINSDPNNVSPLQSVNVSAANETNIFGLPVNVTKGTVAIGLGVDIGIIDNDTTAQVRDGATIDAQQDIDVHALDRIETDSFIANISRPDKIGAAVTMSLYSLRGNITDQISIPFTTEKILPLSELNTVGASNLYSDIDGLVAGLTQPGGGLRATLDGYDGALPGIGDAGAKLGAATPLDLVTDALSGAPKGTGTTVVVDGATLHAGRDVLLSADERSNLAADTVTATDIAYAIDNADDDGTLLAVANDRAYAFTHTMAVTNVSGSTINAGRNVSVTGHVENDQSLTGTTGGNFVKSSTGAVAEGGTHITAGGAVDVQAHADLFDTTWSILPRFDGKQIKSGSNMISGSTQAVVKGDSSVTAGSYVHVNAIDDVVGLTVANSFTVGQDSKNAGKFPTVGAALGFNTVDRTILAAVEDSSLTGGAGDVEVTATSNPWVVSVGLGIAEAEQYLVLGGSMAQNVITNTVDAHLSGHGTVSSPNSVVVEAKDNAKMVSVGGAAAIASSSSGSSSDGAAAAGASVAFNTIGNTIRAYVQGNKNDSMVVDGPAIIVRGAEDVDITAVAVGGSGAEKFSLGGSYVENHLQNDIQAFVGNNAQLTADRTISVVAKDDGTIVAVSGAAAISTDGLAVGAAISHNKNEDKVYAYVMSEDDNLFQQEFDTILTADTITVAAENSQEITAISAAGTYGDKAAVNGSVSQNIISGSTRVTVSDQPKLDGSSAINLLATDHLSIHAVSGAAAISDGKVAAAGSVSENIIGSTTEVLLTSGTLGPGSITLKAENSSSIMAISGAGTYSDGLSGAGAVSINKLDNNVNATVNGQFVTDLNADSVLVEAHNKTSIEALIASLSYGDKVALSGSITHNEDNSHVSASIEGYAQVTADTITVHAKNEPNVKSLSGAISASQTAAAGDATAINKIKVTNKAKIDGANIHGGSVNVNAETIAYIGTIAVVGSGAGNVAANASQAISEIHNQTDARITGATTKVDGTAVSVKASDDSDIESISGSIALSGDVAGAAAVGENHIGNLVSAIVEQGTVTATTLDVIASSNDDGNDGLVDPFTDDMLNDDIQLIVIGGAGSGKVALSGSVAINDINNVVEALITDAAHVTATSATHVRAADDSGIRVVAGNGQGSGTFAAGAAVATNQSHSTVTAAIEYGADVTSPAVEVTTHSRGNIKAAAAAGGGAGTIAADAAVSVNDIGNISEALVQHGAHVTANSSLTVEANDTSSMLSITGAGAGAGTVAIAAGVAKNMIANQVLAQVSSATLDVGSATIHASDTSHIEAVSVGVAVAGSVAVTGGVGINEIGNSVEANISGDSLVTAKGNVTVHAHDDSTVSALTGQGGGAFVGVGGAASYNDIQNHVRSYIDGSEVHSKGSVFVKAEELATIEEIAIGANAGFVGIGGNVSVNLMQSNTEAFIHHSQVDATNNMVVSAESENALGIAAGQVAAGFVGAAGTVVVNTMENTTRAYIDDSTVSALGVGSATQVKKWNSSTGEETLEDVSGLAVVANSIERPHDPIDGNDVPTLAAVNGAGGFVGVQGLVSVNSVNDHTDAFISRSHVNSEDNFGGQVLVRAHTDDRLWIISGGLAAGAVGVGATVDRSQITSTTRAFITNEDQVGDGANAASVVYGTGVEVSTVSREKIDEVIVGFAAGAGALAGTVSVADVSATNEAFVDNSEVNSKGYLRVLADDTAQINPSIGTFTGGALGIGAAVSVNTIKTTVRAQALGATLNATGAMTIQADSDEKISPLVGTGSIGLVALAGAVTVDTIETTTEALTKADVVPTLINQNQKFQKGGAYAPGGGQSVTIKADDTANITGNTGTIAGGGAGIGASIDVGAIRNRTVAQVGTKTQIDAVGNVNVLAHADRDMTSNVVAFTGGLVGLSGAVSVLTLGGDIAADAMNEFTHPGDNSNKTLLGETNESLKTPDVSQTIDYNENNGGDPTAQKAAQHVKDLDDASVTEELNGTAGTDRITAAIIEHSPNQASGVQIHAGGNVTVKAEHLYHVSQLTGTAAGGLLAAGAGISVSTINNVTRAYLGSNDAIAADGNVTIHASDEQKENPTTLTSLGAAAGAFEVNANVVNVTLTTFTDAYVSGNASIEQGDAVTVEAVQKSNMEATGKGYGLGALAAAGGVIVDATVTANVNANVNNLASIGSDNHKVGSLSVAATATNDLTVDSEVGHAGGLAFNGGTGTAAVTANVGAKIGDADVDATGVTQIAATSTATADSKVKELAAGLVSGGLALATTTIGGTIEASIADGANIDSGDLFVTADRTATATADARALGVGFSSVNAAKGTATIHGDIDANIGDATVTTFDDVEVEADAVQTATASAGQLAGSLIAAKGGASAPATIDGNVQAHIDAGADITAGGLLPGDVSVIADATNHATSTVGATAAGLALFGASAAEAEALVDVDTRAFIQQGHTHAKGNILVQANSTNQADADADGEAYGLVAVGGVLANATVNGVTRTAADGVLTTDLGSLTVETLDEDSHAVATAKSAGGGVVEVSGAESHAKLYSDSGIPHLRALINDGANVDVGGDVIVRVNTTDAMATATTTGVSVSLVKINSNDDTTTAGGSIATADLSPNIRASVGGNGTIVADGNVTIEALKTGGKASATAYAADASLLFGESGAAATANAKADVAATVGNSTIDADNDVLLRADAKNEAFATAKNTAFAGLLGIGDVQSTATASGKTKAIADDNSQLEGRDVKIVAVGADYATTTTHGSGLALIDIEAAKATTNINPTVTAKLGEGAIATAHRNLLMSSESKAEGDAFARADTGGLGTVGLAFAHVELNPIVETIVSTGAHAHADQDATFKANSGISKPEDNAGDNISTATAEGQGAEIFLGEQGGKATVKNAPETRVSIAKRTGGPTIDAGRDISITTKSDMDVAASATNGNIGAAGGAQAFAGTDTDNVSEVLIAAGAKITAGDDLSIKPDSNNSSSADASAHAIGGFNIAESDAYADIDYTTRVQVGDGAQLTAGDEMHLVGNTSSTGYVNADSYWVGGVGHGSANDSADEGDGNDQDDLEVGQAQRGLRIGFHQGLTQIEIGNGAKLDAELVELKSNVAHTGGTSIGSAISVAGGSDLDALARVELYDDADVRIHSGAQITGRREVDLTSEVQFATSTTSAYADEQGFEPGSGASSTTINATLTLSEINADDGAVITTHDLKVKALLDDASQSYSEITSAAFKNDNPIRDFSPDRIITFDADVELLSGRAVLIIDSDGSVLEQEGVTFTATPTSIVVDPIVNTSPGTASFETPQYFNILDPQNPLVAPSGLIESLHTITGADPFVINFHQTLDKVYIENRSAKDLVIDDIHVVNTTVNPTVTINAQLIQLQLDSNLLDLEDAFGFDVTHSFPGTPIEIQQNHPSSGNDIKLTGLIDNPVGYTHLISDGGGVLATPGSLVRTNKLDIESQNEVGTSANRLKVDLVDIVGASTGLNIDAQGQVWLDLRGVLRDPNVGSFVVVTGILDASNIDILLRPGIKQTAPGAPINYLVDVYEVFPNDHTPTKHHFRPDTNGPISLPLGVFGTGNTAIDTTYSFPLISSTGNIKLVGQDAATDINIVGNTNLYGLDDDAIGSGKTDATTTGDITLAETKADLQIGQVVTTGGDVLLVAKDGNIVDRDNDPQTDVIGNALTLNSPKGGVGSQDNPIEIDSDYSHIDSLVNAAAKNGIFLTEMQLDLNTGLVISDTSDIGLSTVRGSIVDGLNEKFTNIQGVNITLDANSGDLGEQNDYLEICSGKPTPGVATLTADGSIWVYNCGDIRLQVVSLDTGILTIQTPGNIEIAPGGRLSAPKGVNLLAGGDVTTADTSEIMAGEMIVIVGDYQDDDRGVGAKIMLGGSLLAPLIDISGGSDSDMIVLDGTLLGGTTHIMAGDGNDSIQLDGLLVPAVAPSRVGPLIVTLDGQEGSDNYEIDAAARGGAGGVQMNVADTGRTGSDSLLVRGTALADKFAITDGTIYGAGLTVPYQGVEAVGVDGAAGNDAFYVQSAKQGVVTKLMGNAGSDMVEVTGDVPGSIDTATGPMTFAAHPHLANALRGQLVVDGAGGLPSGTQIQSTEGPGASSDKTDIDSLKILNDGSKADDVASLTPTSLTGLGMGAGLGYGNVELLDVFLGNGNDRFTVQGSLTTTADQGGLTMIHGGGNRMVNGVLGGDTITILGSGSPVVVYGDAGNDTINAAAATMRVTAYGGTGNDKITGGSGDDTLVGGAGNDTIDGGAGNDKIFGDDNTPTATRGNDTLKGGLGSDEVWGGPGDDNLQGGSGDDCLVGGGGADKLKGDAGRDILIGGVGKDNLQGGLGEDILIGGDFKLANDVATLDALMAVWGQALPQPQRIDQVRNAGLNTLNILNDGVLDQLLGQNDFDWFWTYSPDTSDRNKSERLK